MQVTQQVYVAEDWVWNTHNKFNAEAQSRCEVEKALDTANHEKTLLAEKFKVVESARQNAKAGLKIAKAQAGDQRKQLYTTQINLATENAAVLDLKAKLQKAHEALKVAQEDAKTAEATVYEVGYCRRMQGWLRRWRWSIRTIALKHTIKPLIGQESLRTPIWGEQTKYTIQKISERIQLPFLLL